VAKHDERDADVPSLIRKARQIRNDTAEIVAKSEALQRKIEEQAKRNAKRVDGRQLDSSQSE